MGSLSRGKRSLDRMVPVFAPSVLVWALASAFSLASPSTLAQALPAGGVAIHGQAQITQPAVNQLLVTTQNGAGSNHSAINWQGFSIGAGASAYFAQPNATSTSINRVVTNTPSQLFGNLGSNGHLVLVNQAGIAVGAGAMIDTAGFTASTLGMSLADAIAGRLRFGDAGVLGTAALTVDGQILARHGDVVLIAPQLDTGASALVQAPDGATVLVAGQQVEITGRGLEGIRLVVQAPEHEARNLGTLTGDAVGIFAGTLRHSGQISATTATLEGGRVVLKAVGGAYVEGQGSITAAGNAPGAKGGSVDVLGHRVVLTDHALVDVSGAQGGGNIRVGGDYQGANAQVPNASTTLLGAQARLVADATAAGDGGRVILWSEDGTRVEGQVSARAGSMGGQGGFVETSGRHGLTVLQAPLIGAGGTWLLDPTDLEIGSVSPTLAFDGFIDVATIQSALASGTSVLATATSSVWLTASIIANVTGTPTLDILAGNTLIFDTNDGIQLTGAPIVTTLSGGAGQITFNPNVLVNVGAGTLHLQATTGMVQSPSSAITAAALSIVSNGVAALDSTLNAFGTVAANITGTDWSVILKSSTAMTVGTVGSVTGMTTSGSFGNVILDSATALNVLAAITAGGEINLTSSGTLSINQALIGSQILLTAATNISIDAPVTSSGTLAATVTTSGSGLGLIVHDIVSSAGAMTISSARGLRVESLGSFSAQLHSDAGQTISANYVEVVASGSQGAFIHNGAGSQSITTSGSNLDGDGLVVSNTTAAGQSAAIINVQGAQSINVGNASNLLVRGLGGDARIDSSGTGGSQLITVPGGWIELDSSSGTGDSFVTGVSQSVSGRRLLITGGIADGQLAGLTNYGGAQTVTIDENISLNGGGAAGVGSSDCVDRGSCVFLTNQGAGAQTVSAGSISLTGGYAGAYNSASLSSQVGAQYLTITGGGVNNYLRLTGGSGAGVNNFALVSAPEQHINFTAAGNVELVGGTNGNNSYASLQSFGAGKLQEIAGAGAVTVTGGASGGADNLGNFASIASAGAQAVAAATIALQGGADGAENFARIQSQGNQSLAATGLALTGGAAGGGFDTGNSAFVRSYASQTISLGAGGLTLTAGGGSLTDNSAMVLQEGTGGTTQVITISGGGDIVMTGGSSAQTNVGGATHGSRALIEALGASQTITLSNGDVTLTGGSAGSRAFAQIYAENGTQTLTGIGALTLTGGTGGVVGEGNFASINAVLGLQTLHAASGTIQGGGAGTENYAGLFAPSQNLRFDGNLTLLGATNTTSGSGARIGGRGDGSTNLVLRVDGALALTASAYSGTSIGGNVTGTPSGQTSTITATVGGDVTLTPSMTLGVVIGAVSPNFLPGSVSITSTGGDILLLGNGGSGSGRAGIASLGNVTLVAAGDITQSPEAALLANQLSVTAGGTIDMLGNNTATRFTASSGSDVLFNNIGALVLGSITTLSGGQNVAITSTGAMTVSGASATDDVWQLTAGGAFTLGAAIAASQVAVSSVGNMQLAANLSATNQLDLSTSGGAIVQTAGTIVSGGIASFYGVGDINLVSTTNDFQLVSAQGATVRIRDANDIALDSFNTTALVVQAAGNLDVIGLLQATRVGDAIVLASTAGQLTVDPDATFQTPNGRWLLYAATPTALSLGSQTAAFIQYGATETSPILGSGNGLMYGVTPTISAVLDPGSPVNKVYDGGLAVSTSGLAGVASGAFSGDVVTLLLGAQGTLDNKNVGSGKAVTTGAQIAGVTNGGMPVYGYAFLSTGTTSGSASGNVGVVTPAPITAVSGFTASKVYDGGTSATVAGTAALAGLVAGDSLGATASSASFADRHVGSGKALLVSGLALTGADAGNYTLATSTASGIGSITQRDLAIWSGAGGNGLWSNAANWDYLPDGANVAKVQIASGVGAVIMDVAGVRLQGLSSTRPVQQTSGSFVTSALLLDTVGGALLTGANQIGALSAVNAGSGDIVLHNTGTLLLGNMANTAGSILIENTGAVISSSLVSAAGDVMVAAFSPLTIGSGGVTAGHDIVLSAGTSSNPGPTDNLTLNGPLNAGNLVNLFAGNALVQNSAVFGANGVTVVALGSFSFGPFASTNNPPVSYNVGNASVAPPPRAVGQLNEGLNNLLSFADDFKILISGESTMPLDPRKDKPQDAIVAEGEICK